MPIRQIGCFRIVGEHRQIAPLLVRMDQDLHRFQARPVDQFLDLQPGKAMLLHMEEHVPAFRQLRKVPKLQSISKGAIGVRRQYILAELANIIGVRVISLVTYVLPDIRKVIFLLILITEHVLQCCIILI